MTAPAIHVQTRGLQLARFIASLAATRGDLLGAEPYAAAKGWTSTTAVLKGLVAPLSQADVANALSPVLFDLAEVLRPLTIVGRLQGMRTTPFRTRVLAQSVAGLAAWVSEGAPIPVRASAFEFVRELDALKVAGIGVVSAELLMNAIGASYGVISQDIVSGVAQELDLAFIDPGNSGSTAKPAAITHDCPTFESTGTSIAAIDADLGKLIGSLTDNNMPMTSAAWVMNPRTATYLGQLRGSGGAAAYPGIGPRGGVLLQCPVLVSNNVVAAGSPGETLIALVEASEICIADDGGGDVELTTEASLQLNDAPAAGAQQQVSLWQMGLVGVKCTRIVNWAPRRPAAVATLRSVAF